MMKSRVRFVLRTGAVVLACLGCLGSGHARERILLDDGWRFHLGDTEGAEDPRFRDRRWQRVRLPHDWSIEHPTRPDAPGNGSIGYFPTGVGCYRKTFEAPEAWRKQRVTIEFEGVYHRANVWINGHELGVHAYGYTPFRFDLTPHLRFGVPNTVFVRVDNRLQPNSRWYTGSGIYRHVWLHVTDPVHIAPCGVFVSTPEVSARQAAVTVAVTVENRDTASRPVIGEVELRDPDGHAVASLRMEGRVPANSDRTQTFRFRIPGPRHWSPEAPHRYTAVSRVLDGGQVLDECSTAFGIRSVQVSAERGFELNGRPLNLVGGNVHHDNGPLGAAAFDRAEERKVEILKAAGFNAVRTAHNPPSTAFLDACDRLGMLVIDEAFDGWAKRKTRHDYATVFEDCWKQDLEAMVRRDRNHPSVVMWSIGNEVYERGNAAGAAIAQAMRESVLNLDTSRPITAGINGLGKPEDWPRLDPLFASLDVAGYNYETARHAGDHARLPARVIQLSETYPADTFASWAAVNNHPYVIGDFVWSGLDYLGEAGIGRVFDPDEVPVPHWEGDHYPWHGAACGDMDIIGGRKPVSHYRNIVWDRGETLYAAVTVPPPGDGEWSLSQWALPPALPSWTWPGQEGKAIRLDVYSRHDAVGVYLNGRLIGRKPTTETEQFRASFEVVYEPGVLRVVGLENGREVEDCVLSTAGAASAIRLLPDRESIHADGQDLCFVAVHIVDEQGRLRPDATHEIRYRLRGPGEIIGIGNGDLTSRESYQANPRRACQGRALVIIRSTGGTGASTLVARGRGLKPARTTIHCQPPR